MIRALCGLLFAIAPHHSSSCRVGPCRRVLARVAKPAGMEPHLLKSVHVESCMEQLVAHTGKSCISRFYAPARLLRYSPLKCCKEEEECSKKSLQWSRCLKGSSLRETSKGKTSTSYRQDSCSVSPFSVRCLNATITHSQPKHIRLVPSRFPWHSSSPANRKSDKNAWL